MATGVSTESKETHTGSVKQSVNDDNKVHLHQAKVPRLTQEEINILEECNTESFWYRCVPLAVACGGTAMYLVKTGYLKAHPRYGATLKTLGAMSLAYVLGKLSYQSTCQQKILDKIPNSNLAQAVKKSRGMMNNFDREANTNSEQDVESTRHGDYSRQDLFFDTAPQIANELDDSLRPSVDREVKPQVDHVQEMHNTVTYEELRFRNREEYNRTLATSPKSPFHQKPFPVHISPSSQIYPQGSVEENILSSSPAKHSVGGKKNDYGDVWEDQ